MTCAPSAPCGSCDFCLAEEEHQLLDETWQPVELGPVLDGHHHQPEPTVLHRDDDMALLYAGQVNAIHGDSGTGKGWVALLAVVQQMRRGHTVMLIDLEDTAASIIARLRLLGAYDHEIRDQLVYVRPQVGFGPLAVLHLVTLIAGRNVTLAVIDSLGEAFGLDAIDENSDAEVGPWLRRVARRLAEAGPAVLLVDHATKAADNPLHPSGSKRKRAAVGGASYLITAPTPLVAGKGGRLRLTTAKDRHGNYRRNEVVGDLVMTPTPTGARVELYSPDAALDGRDADLPIELAVKAAVKAATEASQPLTLRALVGLMAFKGRNDTKRGGIDLAVARGLITETPGPNRSRLFGCAPVCPSVPGTPAETLDGCARVPGPRRPGTGHTGTDTPKD